jgi:hypothetical protein
VKVLNFKCIQNGREIVSFELDIDYGTNDGFYGANGTLSFRC